MKQASLVGLGLVLLLTGAATGARAGDQQAPGTLAASAPDSRQDFKERQKAARQAFLQKLDQDRRTFSESLKGKSREEQKSLRVEWRAQQKAQRAAFNKEQMEQRHAFTADHPARHPSHKPADKGQ